MKKKEASPEQVRKTEIAEWLNERDMLAEEYMPLADFIKLIPRIMPRNACAKLKEALAKEKDGALGDLFAEYGADMLITTGRFGQKLSPARVSFRGADAALALYFAGFFSDCLPAGTAAMSRGSRFLRPMEDYIAKEKTRDSRNAEIAEGLIEREKEINGGRLISAEDFCYEKLDALFIAYYGLRQGAVSLTVGGVAVEKSVKMYCSNSGRGCSAEVVISYETEAGKTALTKSGPHKNNRRNDEERSWGLGRE